MTGWEGLMHGLSVATAPDVLIWCVLGVVLGTFVGVLPGIGAMATISVLLPITYYISGLISYLAKGAQKVGWPWSPESTAAVAIPIVAFSVWWSLRRLHHKLFGRHG